MVPSAQFLGAAPEVVRVTLRGVGVELGVHRGVATVREIGRDLRADSPPKGIRWIEAAHQPGEDDDLVPLYAQAGFARSGAATVYERELMPGSTPRSLRLLDGTQATAVAALLRRSIPSDQLAAALARTIDFDVSWWTWTYRNQLAGAALCAWQNAFEPLGTIALATLAPEFRGRGLGHRLHADALALLGSLGARVYVDAADDAQRAVHQILAKSGCRPKSNYITWSHACIWPED